MGNIKKTPKLRFKGFEGGWENRSMGDLGSFIGGGTPTTNVEKYWIGDIPWISSSDLFEDDLHNINIHRYLNQEAISESATKVIPKNSVLLISRVGVGKLAVNKTELCTSQDFSNFIPDECDSYFIGYLLLGRKNLLINFAQGTSIKGFTTNDIKSLKVSIPSHSEQKKIASFLSILDEKIQQLTCKKEMLEQYKKGAMQQLFSGKLRFKDEHGKEFPKWEKKKLDDLADIKRGAASQHLNYVSDETKGIRLLRINDFLSDGAVYVENTEVMKRYTVRTNDLLIAGTGATAGIIFIVPEKFNNLSFSYNAPRIRVMNAYHTFIYYYLKSDIILKQQQRLFVGNAQPFLDTDAMRGFKIDMPSIEEQKKIANYLSNIDIKIENVNKQITQTQTFKKGLLQQMFV